MEISEIFMVLLLLIFVYLGSTFVLIGNQDYKTYRLADNTTVECKGMLIHECGNTLFKCKDGKVYSCQLYVTEIGE